MAEAHVYLQPGANVEATDTFASWVETTNMLVYDMGTKVVTTAPYAQPNTAVGGYTTGNSHIEGRFSANALIASSELRGGTVSGSANLIVSSNTIFNESALVQIGANTNNFTVNANNTLFTSNVAISNTSKVFTISTANTTITSGNLFVQTAATFTGSRVDIDGTTFDVTSNTVFTSASLNANVDVVTIGFDGTDTLNVNSVTDLNANVNIDGALTKINSTNTTIGDAGTDKMNVIAESIFSANATFNGALVNVTSTNTTIGNAATDRLNVNAVSDFNANVNIDGILTQTANAVFSGALVNITSANTTIGDAPTDKLNVNAVAAFANVVTIAGLTTVSNSAIVSGTLTVNTQANTASLMVRDLTATRVPYVGTAGEIVDSANLVFSGTQLSVTGSAAISGNETVGGTLGVTGAATFANTVAVTGSTTFANTIAVTGAATFSNNAIFGDNRTIILGDAQDMLIYHDGFHSYISDLGTGNLKLDASQLDIQTSNSTATETMATFVRDGAVTLYYDNGKKFETTSGGVYVTGTLGVSGATTLSSTLNVAGTTTAAAINASGLVSVTNSTDATSNTAASMKTAGGLAVAKKLYVGQESFLQGDVTVSAGKTLTTPTAVINTATITGNETVAGTLGVTGATTLSTLSATSGTFSSTLNVIGATTLSTLSATSGTFSSTLAVTGNATFSANVNLSDNDYIRLGTSADLLVYHDGTHSYIKDQGIGNLKLEGSQLDIQTWTGTATETMATFVANGAVTLYHDNAIKIATTATGVSVTGNTVVSNYVTAPYANVTTLATLASANVIGELITNNAVRLGADLTHTTTAKGDVLVEGNFQVLGSTTLADDAELSINVATMTTATIQDLTVNGNTIIGSDSTDRAAIKASLNNNLVAVNNLYDLGSTTNIWRTIYANNVVANVAWSSVTDKPDPVVTVTLTGDVTGTGNATLTDLANGSVSISTTIQPNSVALGTDTTGNYAGSITAGAGITVTGTAGEGTAYTIAHTDTSSQASVNNSNGFVIQDITLDTYGHITSLGSVDLDARYVNKTGDSMTGRLNVTEINGNASGQQLILFAGESVTSGYTGLTGETVYVVAESGLEIISSANNWTDTVNGPWATKNASVIINDAYGNSNFPGNVTVGTDLTVGGNLTVSGTVTTINTETVNIADNIIVLNSNYTGSTPTENGGIEIERGTLANKTLIWDEANDRWTVGSETFVAGTFSGSGASLTSLNASNLSSGTVPDARISGAYTGITNLTANGTITAGTFSGSGASLTSLNASNLSSGTVPDARISGEYTGITNLTANGTITATTFSGALSGNATTATRLAANTTINGANFNGSQIINISELQTSTGALIIDGIAQSTPVNYLQIRAANTGQDVLVTTAGSDTNIDLLIQTKGTGSITLDTGTGAGVIDLKPGSSNVRIWDDTSTQYVQIATGDLTANRTLTLPDANVTLVSGTMVPTTGTGATGTWGISISGNAATATQVNSTLTRGSYLTGNNYNGSAATTWAVDATTTNTASKIVARDASGNFAAGTITATAFSGSGASLTSLNASNLTSGTVPDARISGSYTGLTNLTGTGVFTAGSFAAANGSVTSPAYDFGSDTNTGIYLAGADTLGFATNGTPAAQFTSTGNLRLFNTAGTFYTEISAQPTANRTLTFPDANVTLVSGTMVPTTGTGATGTWGISISGNAATATTAGVATLVTSILDETSTANRYVTFIDATTGNQEIRADAGFKYIPSSGTLQTSAVSATYGNFTDVRATGYLYANTQMGVYSSGGGPLAVINTTVNNGNDAEIWIQKSRLGGVITAGDDIGKLDFQGHNGTSFVSAATIFVDSTTATGNLGGRMQIYTNGVETLRLDENRKTIAYGNIESQGGTLTLTADVPSIIFNDTSTSAVTYTNYVNNNQWILKNNNTAALVLRVEQAGDFFVAGNITSSSDARLKENVVTVDSALDKVSNLRGVYYNKIGETERKLGVIAQEVETIVPEVVNSDADGMKSVAYANMVGLLIEAIKELKAEIDELKSNK